MLKSLQLSNFRGFRDHVVELTNFCLLIGQNNAGKTTIIEALRLVAAALKRAPTGNFQMAPDYLAPTLTGPVFRFAVDTIGIEHKGIHYNYRSEEPAIVRARFSNNSIVTIAIGSEEGEFLCQLTLSGRTKVNSRNQVTARRFPPIYVMPPVGSLLDRETRRERAYMRKHIDGYLSHRHMRNQMAEMPEHFDRFKLMLEDTWERLQLGSVEYGLGERRDEYGLTIRDGPFVSEMGLVGSGLQAWMQTIWFLARVSFDATIVLDEPDIYLHADLQRKLIQLLAGGGYHQTVVATHSMEMISAVSASDIVSVTKREARSRSLTSNAEAQAMADKLGTSYNLQLAKLVRAGVVLFVEGNDHALLDQLAYKQGNAFYVRFSQIPHFSVGGMSNWSRAAMSAQVFHETSAGRIRAVMLIDRDYCSDEQVEETTERAKASFLELYCWRRKEIENYFLDPSTIRNFMQSRCDDDVVLEDVSRAVDEVVAELEGHVLELVADAYQAADRKLALPTAMAKARKFIESRVASGCVPADLISGKAAISKLSAWSKERYGVSFSPMSLCRQMTAARVPAEVSTLLESFVR